jgi:multiple sugar transport system permease protein
MVKKLTIVIHIVAWIIAAIWIIPFLGVFMASIRPYAEISNGWWNFNPFSLTFEGFIKAQNYLSSISFSRSIINSLIVAVPATFIPILVASLAAYSFARFKFPTRDFLFLVIVLLQTIPQQAVIVPLFNMAKDLHLLNTYISLILVHTAFGLPWIILFLRNFFSTLPVEIEEAAIIDGASHWKVFYKIVLPLSLPALASVIALQFVWVWNDFFFALTLIQAPEMRLSTQVIATMATDRFFLDWNMVSAASLLVMIVPIAIYAALQRYYVRGLVAGAVKG